MPTSTSCFFFILFLLSSYSLLYIIYYLSFSFSFLRSSYSISINLFLLLLPPFHHHHKPIFLFYIFSYFNLYLPSSIFLLTFFPANLPLFFLFQYSILCYGILHSLCPSNSAFRPAVLSPPLPPSPSSLTLTLLPHLACTHTLQPQIQPSATLSSLASSADSF